MTYKLKRTLLALSIIALLISGCSTSNYHIDCDISSTPENNELCSPASEQKKNDEDDMERMD